MDFSDTVIRLEVIKTGSLAYSFWLVKGMSDQNEKATLEIFFLILILFIFPRSAWI